MASQKVKIGYWPFQGFGQLPKYLLEYTGIEYEVETKFTFEDWAKEKSSGFMDFPNLPYLIDGETKISEVLAICYHIAHRANKTDLLGKTQEDIVQVLMIFGVLADIRTSAVKAAFSNPDEFESVKQKEVQSVLLPKATLLNKRLGGKDSFLGYYTIADFFMYHMIQFLKAIDDKIFGEFENLKKFEEEFEKQEWLKEFKKSKRFIPFVFGPLANAGKVSMEEFKEFYGIKGE